MSKRVKDSPAIQRMIDQGPTAIVDTLLDVMADKKATSQARASAARTMAEILGLTKQRIDEPTVDLADMSREEIRLTATKGLAELYALRDEIQTAIGLSQSQTSEKGSIFD